MKPFFTVLLLSFVVTCLDFIFHNVTASKESYLVTPAIYVMTTMTTADLNPEFESLYYKCASHRQIKKLLPTKALKFKISKVPLKQAKPQQMYGILGIRNLSSPSFKMYKAWLIVSFKNHSGGKDWICDGISYATVGLKPVFFWRGFSARKSWPSSSCSQRQRRFLPFFIILRKGIILIHLSLKKSCSTRSHKAEKAYTSFLCDCTCIHETLRTTLFSTHRQQITPGNAPISSTPNKLPPRWPLETVHVNTWRDVYISPTFALSLMTTAEIKQREECDASFMIRTNI